MLPQCAAGSGGIGFELNTALRLVLKLVVQELNSWCSGGVPTVVSVIPTQSFFRCRRNSAFKTHMELIQLFSQPRTIFHAVSFLALSTNSWPSHVSPAQKLLHLVDMHSKTPLRCPTTQTPYFRCRSTKMYPCPICAPPAAHRPRS